MILSESKVAILQILRTKPECLYEILVVAGPFNGTRTTANETDLAD